MLAFSEETKARAKERKHYLIQLKVGGRYADGGTMEFAFDLPRSRTMMIVRLVTRLLKEQEELELKAARRKR